MKTVVSGLGVEQSKAGLRLMEAKLEDACLDPSPYAPLKALLLVLKPLKLCPSPRKDAGQLCFVFDFEDSHENGQQQFHEQSDIPNVTNVVEAF